MKELVEIINAYDTATKAGKGCVLATVVHVEGSSYRRPGARMLVLDNGLMIGAISGGCLEGDALKKALLTFTEKKSRLVTYDTSDEDDATVGIQLGCEGVIQVLFEFIHSNDLNNPIELLRKVIAKRQRAAVVTLFDLSDKKKNQIGTCFVLEENGDLTNAIMEFPPLLEPQILADAQVVIVSGISAFKTYKLPELPANYFIDFIQPCISLVVVGAGNDAVPLMQMAGILGWEVKVVDGRNTHAKQDRFISACQVLVSKPEKVLEQITIDYRTCFVLMTHNYQYDLQMLKALLPKSIPYIGLLGPRKKLTKILEDLSKEGIVVTSQELSKIYGPTGLDIGAETSEEIASSIIAEIQAVVNGKSGNMLKDKQDQIHQ